MSFLTSNFGAAHKDFTEFSHFEWKQIAALDHQGHIAATVFDEMATQKGAIDEVLVATICLDFFGLQGDDKERSINMLPLEGRSWLSTVPQVVKKIYLRGRRSGGSYLIHHKYLQSLYHFSQGSCSP